METLATTVSLPIHLQPSDYDEISMQRSMLLGDSLKDLKNLRTQLYTAAEYFEVSYTSDDQKQIVVNTLKDYAVKALVNTVDHVGSVTYKVNDLLDEKVKEVSGIELHVSRVELRLRKCQEYVDREGVAQQSSIINTPRHHKQYTLPAGEPLNGKNNARLKGSNLIDVDCPLFRSVRVTTIKGFPRPLSRKERSPSPSPQPSHLPGSLSFNGSTSKKDLAVRASTLRETLRPLSRNGHSPSPSPRPSQLTASLSFTDSTPEKDLDSPQRFLLFHSGSVAARPATSKASMSASPNLVSERPWRYPTVPQKSASMRAPEDRSKNVKELERHPSRGKQLLKALLGRRKSKKDGMLYTYLDEY